jgi:GT2 family glycosyltransferase
VSVVVPNYNGDRFLRDCLESLEKQTYARVECLVVDDASTDSSPNLVERDFSGMRLIRLERNRGFAHAANTGMRAAKGEIVALLNNDAAAAEDWVAQIVAGLDRHPEAGSIACKMVVWDRPNVINSAGDVFLRAGVPDSRGVWQVDEGQYEREEEVFGASGGACAYRRSMLDEIGLFDERFFMYCEDVDLAFRAQLRGYSCVYVPGAVVRHRVSATAGGPMASYYCGRNFLWVLAKDFPRAGWRRYWPRILATQLGLALAALRHGREPAARARLRGQIEGLVTLRPFFTERIAQ